MEEAQCKPIKAYAGPVDGGSLDGSLMVIVAWKPEPRDLERINRGEPIYISMIGGLAPHFLTTSFEEARRPA